MQKSLRTFDSVEKASKAAYQTPQLVVYGTIRQITQMTAEQGKLDNATQGRFLFTRLR